MERRCEEKPRNGKARIDNEMDRRRFDMQSEGLAWNGKAKERHRIASRRKSNALFSEGIARRCVD
jgi:hypothetical protein